MNKSTVAVFSCAVAMSCAAMVKPLEGPWLNPGEKLVCFGDSITAGKNYYIRFLRLALETSGVTVVNAGLSGDKTPMALTRIRDVAAEKPDAVMIFVAPPSLEELERRLRGRGTDTERAIEARLIRARQEFEEADFYDYLIINDDLDKAARELNAIIDASHCRFADRAEKLKNL